MSSLSTYLAQDLCGTSTCSWRKGFIASGLETLGTVGVESHPLPQYLQAKRANDPTGGPSS